MALLGNSDSAATRIFFAPGRANLLGAHMDYNGGCVLPVALSRGTYGAFRLRQDGMLRLRSENFPGEEIELPLSALKPGRTQGWSAYIEGALWTSFKEWEALPGLEVALAADLPMAKGLSSSASVESVTVFAVSQLLGVRADADEMIRLAHEAENHYVGVRCGILDQAAIFLAREDSMLLLDCLELTREHLPLDSAKAMVAITDSGVRRNLASSAFNQRVSECTRALAHIQEKCAGITCLRDVRRELFEEVRDHLPPVLQRRVMHVVSEVERTEKGADGLRHGDLHAFGNAMTGAHESLRDQYEVSTPELDLLVEAAVSIPACYGSRLTGAGFGGCTAALVHPEGVEEFSRKVPEIYRRKTGRQTEVLWFSPSGGPQEI